MADFYHAQSRTVSGRPRILHLVHTPRHSGAEILVRELCLRHQGDGLNSAIAAFAPPDPTFVAEIRGLENHGVETFFPDKPLRHLHRVQFFRSVYRSFLPDIVFGHSVLPALYGRAALPWFGRRVRFAGVLHSADNDDYASLYFRCAEYLLRYKADLMIGVSPEGVASYRRHFGARRVCHIPNGIDVNRFQIAARSRERHRNELGLSPDDRLILQTGRISPVKQQQHTLVSLRSMLNSMPNLKLWFAGIEEDRAYSDGLRALVTRNDWGDRVRILGGRSDIPELLASADLFVMPSLAEAQSISFIEAIASGVPILASRLPSFLFAAEYPGVALVEPHDEEAFRDAAATLIDQGRQPNWHSASLDISITAAAYRKWAESLCQFSTIDKAF